MTKSEFGKFAAALKTYYPREQLLPNREALELWYNQLSDLPYDLAEIALQKWVATEKWSPSISEIREITSAIANGDIPDWGQAWETVQRAIRRYGSYQPQEAYEMMDEVSRTVVKQMGWRNLCFSENEAADRANFRMMYERAAERKKLDNQLPVGLKNLIGQMQIGMIEKSKSKED